jgi:hypothetical protein
VTGTYLKNGNSIGIKITYWGLKVMGLAQRMK